jgi:NADPH-dependent ferric siderophore reductase
MRFVVPNPPRRYLLVGDAASRLAINKIFPALPVGVSACVVLEHVHDDELTIPPRGCEPAPMACRDTVSLLMPKRP